MHGWRPSPPGTYDATRHRRPRRLRRLHRHSGPSHRRRAEGWLGCCAGSERVSRGGRACGAAPLRALPAAPEPWRRRRRPSIPSQRRSARQADGGAGAAARGAVWGRRRAAGGVSFQTGSGGAGTQRHARHAEGKRGRGAEAQRRGGTEASRCVEAICDSSCASRCFSFAASAASASTPARGALLVRRCCDCSCSGRRLLRLLPLTSAAFSSAVHSGLRRAHCAGGTACNAGRLAHLAAEGSGGQQRAAEGSGQQHVGREWIDGSVEQPDSRTAGQAASPWASRRRASAALLTASTTARWRCLHCHVSHPRARCGCYALAWGCSCGVRRTGAVQSAASPCCTGAASRASQEQSQEQSRSGLCEMG